MTQPAESGQLSWEIHKLPSYVSSAQQNRKVSGSRTPISLIWPLNLLAEASSSDPVAVTDRFCNWLHLAELIKDRKPLLCCLL